MASIRVTYPESRVVFLDDAPFGLTNETQQLPPGTYTTDLGAPVDYTPGNRTVSVTAHTHRVLAFAPEGAFVAAVAQRAAPMAAKRGVVTRPKATAPARKVAKKKRKSAERAPAKRATAKRASMKQSSTRRKKR
ncbi:MAG: hypothetical protein IT359_15390 [Gemmatimonadaceae bacterium]|nr:hypothetical protein [Gemmatimonadaceae bacterium]